VLLGNPVAELPVAPAPRARQEVCTFGGLTFSVQAPETTPPCLYVESARERAVLAIIDGAVIEGGLACRPTLAEVRAWLASRRDAALLCWARAQAGLPAGAIEPP
jgi:hypothetical protein